MNLRQLTKHLQADIVAGNAAMVRGQPGLGKTALMKLIHAWMRKHYAGKRVGLSVNFMATWSVVTGTGLPWKGEKDYGCGAGPRTVTDPAMPTWYLAYCAERNAWLPADMFDVVLCVLEEWGQGNADVKRMGSELILTGAIDRWRLPPGSPRIALTNVDSRDGITKEFDLTINRVHVIDAHGDANVWLEDFAEAPYQWEGAKRSVMPFTKVWVKNNPTIPNEPKPDKQGPWCTWRSLTAWDRFAQAWAEAGGGMLPHDDPEFIESTAGYIGHNATAALVRDLQFMIELTPYEDIIADPAGAPVPNRADLMLLMAYTLAGRVSQGDIAPVIEYVDRLPQDLAITFVKSLMRRDYTFQQLPAMQAWIKRNATLIGIISQLVGA
jgi:hypothetical protein